MGDDELAITIFSAIGAGLLWGVWLLGSSQKDATFYRNQHLKNAGILGGVLVAVMLFAVLKLWASHDVRDAPEYLAQYWFMGAAFAAGAGVIIMPLLGISWNLDVLEYRNPAAAFAWIGAVGGFTLAYAGSNIGDGPGWWVVVFCSFVSCGFLVFLWVLFELVAHVSERITVERDIGAGIRFGGLMLGMGIVAGRGAAGNWMGVGNAISDFGNVVIPALPLAVVALVIEVVLRPRPSGSYSETMAFGGIPGALFLAGGLFYVVLLKPW